MVARPPVTLEPLTKAIILLILTHFLWSTNQIIGKVLVTEIPPLTLAMLRWIIAVPFLAFLLRSERAPFRPDRGLSWIVVLALSGIFAFNSFLYLSLAFISASRSAIIYGFTPALITLFALSIREIPTKPQTAGIGISIAGILIITARSSLGQLVTSQSIIGDVIALGASLSWAIYTVAGRKAMSELGYTPKQATFYAALYSIPFFLVASSLELYSGAKLVVTGTGIVLLFYVSVVVAVLGFTWWYVAVRTAGANVAGPFSNLIPVFASILGYTFLGESLSPRELLGGALVIFGALLSTYSRRPKLED